MVELPALFRPAMRPIFARLAFAILPAALPATAQDADFAAQAVALYRTRPAIAGCRAGELQPAQRQRVLALINDIRRLHGLDAVDDDPAAEPEATQAALVIAANGRLSHAPTPDWRCYSGSAAKGARRSLIYGGVSSPLLRFSSADEIVIEWLTDANNVSAGGLGHRRWLLDPFLQRVAFGMVAGRNGAAFSSGAALRLVPTVGVAARTREDFVAWPIGEYPGRYYADDALLSFTALPDRKRKFANRDVDYADAQVEIRERDGRQLQVRNLSEDHEGFGVPNSLQFRVPRLQPGVIYDVTIRGVRFGGQSRDYRYWFRIGQSPRASTE
ncbi:CAP domain-containing protein [Xanthomonas axonopodis pv. ricini]|uniref:CAP domain-containing protein n=1 Tax=Xanthomonas euvesicatoria TaxID=456327 RepID=UPI002455A9D5|nr:CAP domain-containing protein [Xanthomonas euvesicatoria]MDH4907541.1 CAP domain-containing protein [Xanthomonas euvesicatoria]